MQLAEQNQMEIMLFKEECDAREAATSDKLIRAELEIERLRSQVRCCCLGVQVRRAAAASLQVPCDVQARGVEVLI